MTGAFFAGAFFWRGRPPERGGVGLCRTDRSGEGQFYSADGARFNTTVAAKPALNSSTGRINEELSKTDEFDESSPFRPPQSRSRPTSDGGNHFPRCSPLPGQPARSLDAPSINRPLNRRAPVLAVTLQLLTLRGKLKAVGWQTGASIPGVMRCPGSQKWSFPSHRLMPEHRNPLPRLANVLLRFPFQFELAVQQLDQFCPAPSRGFIMM